VIYGGPSAGRTPREARGCLPTPPVVHFAARDYALIGDRAHIPGRLRNRPNSVRANPGGAARRPGLAGPDT
jgi:hypothetical protein